MSNRPNFLIIGAQKCATTSLWARLREHPGVHVANEKELRFFDGYAWDNGIAWYEGNFDPDNDTLFNGDFDPERTPVGEASPIYLHRPIAIERIAAYRPDMRLIIMLRDPVRRAVSHYWWEVQMQNETLDMLEAIRAEESRQDDPHHFGAYKERGRYCEQLDRVFKRFPREQVFIGHVPRLDHSPDTFLERVEQFIGAPSYPNYPPLVRYLEQSYPEPPPDVVRYLSDYFAPHNQALHDRYGIDISGWL